MAIPNFPQTEYPVEFGKPFEGAPYDGSFDSYRITASNVTGPSFFGRACLAVAGSGQRFVQPSGGAEPFLGVLQHSAAIEQSQVDPATGGLPAEHPGAIVRKGRIWVVAETVINDITAGVFYRNANAGADPEALGRFRNDAAGGDAIEVPQARWVFVTSAVGEMAVIELNLP